MKRIDFENGTVTGNILAATLPMLVAQILNLLYNIVDRVYIARIPEVGTAVLGAVGLCFPLIVIITAFANLFGSGGAPLFSIYRGKKTGKLCRTDHGYLFLHALHLRCFPDARRLSVCPSDTDRIRCFSERSDLCLLLYDDLPDRNYSIHDLHWDESFYQCSGLLNHRYAFCWHWRCCKPSA